MVFLLRCRGVNQLPRLHITATCRVTVCKRSFSQSTSLQRDDTVAAKNTGPLKGVKILDLSRVLAAPYCTQILADYGADVIKVEDIDRGDDTRYWTVDGEKHAWTEDAGPISNYFAAVNRNKRSICLNLKQRAGQEIFFSLVRSADVVVDNFRPGTLEKLGLGYDKLSTFNSRIIHASVSGYGEVGPFAKRAGYDMIAAAEAGLLHLTGTRDGPPVRPGLGLTDLCTGLFMHGAIVAALYARQSTGRGQKISASLFETQVALLSNVALAWLNLGQEAQKWGTQHPSVVPYDAFKTSDLHFVCGATNDAQFKILCRYLKLDSLVDDERFITNANRVQNRNELFSLLDDAFKTKSTDEWITTFEGSGLPYAPINTMERVFSHPQTEATGMVCKLPYDNATIRSINLLGPAVKFGDTPATIRSLPPRLGEQTDEILSELDIPQEEIGALKEGRVVR